VVFPTVLINIPNLGHIAVGAFGLFVWYAIMKYDLFTFDAALAAENIISTMPDSLVLADMQGKMLRINKRLVNFLGYEEDELKGKPLTELCAQEKACTDLMNALTEKRAIRNHELVLKTISGDERVVLFSGSVVRSKTGRDIGITCIIHDITDRKELEERFVKTERLASIGELAGQIGHDLRNPLTGIKSGAYFLRRKGNALTDVDRERILGMIDNAVEDSNRIINSLLDYSGDLHLEPERCTPKSILNQALSKLHIPNHINIVDHTEDGPEMFLDTLKMGSVFLSLIQNAIEACPKQGTIEVSSAPRDSNVEIAVIDSGVGIPESIMVKAFSPLTTTKAKGMGMGLAICKRVVDAHGGKISIESTLGVGTTVRVVLPVKQKVEFAVVSDWTTVEQKI
jgi:PAS domain S-box-containing protein